MSEIYVDDIYEIENVTTERTFYVVMNDKEFEVEEVVMGGNDRMTERVKFEVLNKAPKEVKKKILDYIDKNHDKLL